MNVMGPLDMNETHKSRPNLDTNTTSLDKRLQAIFDHRSTQKNAVNEIETFNTIREGFHNQNKNTEELDLKLKEEKWKLAFRDLSTLNKDDFKKWLPPLGLHKLLSGIFYLYPRITGVMVDEFVDSIPKTMEGGMSDRE